jgi:hypothetical protein
MDLFTATGKLIFFSQLEMFDAHIDIYSCKKYFFSFPVAVNNSIKLGPLVLF